jgi:uncharacterized OsmC-like protein
VGQQEIKQALDGAIEYLTNNRAEAKYTDSPATARLAPPDGLAVEVTGPDNARLKTDMPRSVGGANTAPSPGWILRAAEASCIATLIGMRAAQLQVALQEVEVTVDSESDDYGILGIRDDVPAGPLSTRVTVRINAAPPATDAATTPTLLREIVDWAIVHCPVIDAVRRAVPVNLEVTIA